MRIYDTSRKLSDDRWTVSLLVEINISVVNSLFKQGKILTEELNKIKEVIGEAVVFKKTTERFFVDQALKRGHVEARLADPGQLSREAAKTQHEFDARVACAEPRPHSDENGMSTRDHA